MWRHCIVFTLLAIVIACDGQKLAPETRPDMRSRIAAANVFAQHYPLSNWNIHVSASGHDCAVLLVQSSTAMDDAMVEAMHYGSGPYAIDDGGVEHFSRQHAFRAVAYRDASGRVWTYGAVDTSDAERLSPCS